MSTKEISQIHTVSNCLTSVRVKAKHIPRVKSSLLIKRKKQILLTFVDHFFFWC